MLRRMEPNRHQTHRAEASDAEIAILLDRVEVGTSIVDRLFELPLPATGGYSPAPVWDVAVANRMEQRLAHKVRSMIEGDTERRIA